MRALRNKPQVQAPTLSYPYGRIKDDTGLEDGTPLSEDVYGDFHQFFAKLMDDAGIAANELPENEYDGFQLNSALIAFIKRTMLPDAWVNLTLINGWIAGTVTPQYRKGRDGRIHFRGILDGHLSSNVIFSSSLPGSDQIYYLFATNEVAGSGVGAAGTYGLIQINGTSGAAWDTGINIGTHIYLDNLSYWIS